MENTMSKEVVLNVPMSDLGLLNELINKFGWQIETREQMLEKFVKSRPKKSPLSEEEIMNEVHAIRYSK